MKSFEQFVETLYELKINIRGNLCHEFGKFTACDKKSESAVHKSTTQRKKVSSTVIEDDIANLKKVVDFDIDDDTLDYLKSKKITPTDLVKSVIGMDLSKKHEGRLSLSLRDNALKIDANNVTHATGAKILTCKRSINFNKQSVEHSYLELEFGAQGANTVKEMFKSALPMYKKLRMKKITLHANLTAGGYAWAKYGFEPDGAPDNYDAIYNIAEEGQNRLDEFIERVEKRTGNKLSPEAQKEYESVKKMLVPNGLKLSLINQVANLKTKHLDEFIDTHKAHRLFGNDETEELDYIPPQVKMSTAKLLMYRVDWYGELYLSGSSNRKLKKYINQ